MKTLGSLLKELRAIRVELRMLNEQVWELVDVANRMSPADLRMRWRDMLAADRAQTAMRDSIKRKLEDES